MHRFPSIDELRQYLRELQSRSAYQEMITITGEVLAGYDREGKLDEDYGTVLKMHANALLLNSDYAGAEEVYQRGYQLFEQLGMASSMVQCRLRIARCAMWRMDLPRARRLIEALIHELPDGFTLLLHAEAVEVLGRVLLRQHEMAEAIAQLGVARELYSDAGQPYHALITANNQALACIEHGDYDLAGSLLDECYEGLIKLGEYRRAWDIRISRAILLTQQGQLNDARAILLDCFEDVKRYDDFHSHFRLFHQLALIEVLTGNLHEAELIIRQLLSEPQTSNIPDAEGVLMLLKAVTELLKLNLTNVTELLNEIRGHIGDEDEPSHIFLAALQAVQQACTGQLADGDSRWKMLDLSKLRKNDAQSLVLLQHVLASFTQPGLYPGLSNGVKATFTQWNNALTIA